MSEHESKENLLAAAKSLMLARGYAATTVDAICAKAGLTKGSFYHFYKSKEDLGLAVLDWSLAKGSKMLAEGAYTSLADPVERAFGFMEHVEKCSGQLWSDGCLLGSFALELAETHERMQRAVSAMFQQVADQMRDFFQPVVEAAPGDAPSAAELADQYLGTLEGAIILGKAHRDWTRIPRALRGFRRYMEAFLMQPV